MMQKPVGPRSQLQLPRKDLSLSSDLTPTQSREVPSSRELITIGPREAGREIANVAAGCSSQLYWSKRLEPSLATFRKFWQQRSQCPMAYFSEMDRNRPTVLPRLFWEGLKTHTWTLSQKGPRRFCLALQFQLVGVWLNHRGFQLFSNVCQTHCQQFGCCKPKPIKIAASSEQFLR